MCRSIAMWVLLVTAGSLLGACEEEPGPPVTEMLVDHDLWVALGEDDDPFEDRPAEFECSPLAWGNDFIGEESLEVDLGDCDYLSAAQPSLQPVQEGDVLSVRLWHNSLVGEDGEGHIALLLDGRLFWEVHVEIPGESELLTQSLPSTFFAAAGSELVFHLHNHGSNAYNLIEVSVTHP